MDSSWDVGGGVVIRVCYMLTIIRVVEFLSSPYLKHLHRVETYIYKFN